MPTIAYCIAKFLGSMIATLFTIAANMGGDCSIHPTSSCYLRQVSSQTNLSKYYANFYSFYLICMQFKILYINNLYISYFSHYAKNYLMYDIVSAFCNPQLITLEQKEEKCSNYWHQIILRLYQSARKLGTPKTRHSSISSIVLIPHPMLKINKFFKSSIQDVLWQMSIYQNPI